MKRILYLGTDSGFVVEGCEVIHYPVIRLVPRIFSEEERIRYSEVLRSCSHCFFTSKNAVSIFFSTFPEAWEQLKKKSISIGPVTTKALQEKGISPLWEAVDFSQEGLIEEMQKHSWEGAYIFYPRSSLARPLLLNYLQNNKIACEVLDLYDTLPQMLTPVPCLEEIDEILFTSPSTIKAFFAIFPSIPDRIKTAFQGSVTKKAFFSYESSGS